MRSFLLILMLLPALTFAYPTNTAVAIIHGNGKNAGLYYHRGRDFYQQSDYGQALLNFQRAMILDSHNPLFKQAVKQTRDTLNLPRLLFEQNALEKILLFPFTFPSLNGMAAIGLFLLIIGSLIWSGFLSRFFPVGLQQNKILKRTGIALFFISVIYITGAVIRYRHDFNPNRAICVRPTPLFERPNTNQAPLTTLSVGIECRIKKTSGDFYLVQSLAGEEGWANKTNARRIWPK